MISACYLVPDGPPVDGDDLASGYGWLVWSNFVLARHTAYPACANLAQFGWSDDFDALEHELSEIPHDEETDPDVTATSAQVLAAVKARPPECVEFRATTGEDDEGEEEPLKESVVIREHAATAPFPGGVFNESTHHWEKPDGSKHAAEPSEKSTGVPHEHKEAIEAAVEQDLPKEVTEKPGLVGRLKNFASNAFAKAYIWASVHLGSTTDKVGNVLGAIIDTPSDITEKLGYNPTAAGVAGHATTHDPIQTTMQSELGVGISGHLAIKITSIVLTRLAGAIAKKMAAPKMLHESVDGDGIDDLAELIAQLFAHVNAEFGLEGAPESSEIAEKLRGLIGE